MLLESTGSIEGRVTAGGEARRRVVLSGRSTQVSELDRDLPARFLDVLPGDYKLCALPLEQPQPPTPAGSEGTCGDVRVGESPELQELLNFELHEPR